MDNLEKAAGALVPLCVAEGFETEGRIVKLSPLGEGHINRTYKVTCALADGGTKKYVFQRINTKIFKKPVELMDNVYISMHVTVMPNVRINRNCIISAGSVVTSDIPENSIASGIPAKPTGRFDMFMALRKMGKNQTVAFKRQQLPQELTKKEWERFERRHES